MASVSLSRQLSSTIGLSARSCQSSVLRSAPAPALTPWTCIHKSTTASRSQNRSNFILTSETLQSSRRCFSTTSLPFSPPSSPFRLSSKPVSKYENDVSYEEPSLGENGDHEYYSPYKPKRQWPPDMSQLSPKHQFRLERKYRRRAALKYARPQWVKATKLVQWGIIGFVLIYAILFMDWETDDHPFEEFRKEFFATMDTIFSPLPPPGRRSDPPSGK